MSSTSRSGVFEKAADNRVLEFSESISFDHRLFRHDITASKAHAEMLSEIGILSVAECTSICETLDQIGAEIADGSFKLDVNDEDIHMNIERALTERLGDVGRKLHTGRSRNDQVSTDFRLWVRDALDQLDSRLWELQGAFFSRCEVDKEITLPAYTHLQRAQPVLAAHYWLAYCEKFQRDRARVADCRKRVNQFSLGAAALAGTSIPIDRESVA